MHHTFSSKWGFFFENIQDLIVGFTVMDHQWQLHFFCQFYLPDIMFKLNMPGSILFNKIKSDFTVGDNLFIFAKIFKFVIRIILKFLDVVWMYSYGCVNRLMLFSNLNRFL